MKAKMGLHKDLKTQAREECIRTDELSFELCKASKKASEKATGYRLQLNRVWEAMSFRLQLNQDLNSDPIPI